MSILTFRITNSEGHVTGEYLMDCADRPGIDSEAFDSRYTLDLIRSHAERHIYLSDFMPDLTKDSVHLDLTDLCAASRLQNVNELWFEVENLFHGARLNFVTARMLRSSRKIN